MLFISPQKLFSYLKYLNLCPDFFVHVGKRLIRKQMSISKFMKSSTGKLIIATNILPNISRSKDNLTMKLGQIIEYNMRYNFIKQSYTKCGGETSLRDFSKNRNSAYLSIKHLKFYTVYFYCMSKSRTTKIY